MVAKNHALATNARRTDDEERECEAGNWVDQETVDGTFKDERLGRRFKTLLSDIGGAIGASLPFACQDWANTKAAYRFLSNERVDEADILSGHFQATAKRFAASDGMILVLQDTTEFSFKRERPEAIGFTKIVRTGNTKDRRKTVHAVCGILMHSSLAVTTDGLPLGVAAIKFWNRKKFKGKQALTTKVNPTRVPIEKKESIRWLQNLEQSTALLAAPDRCVHVGDRESDIYELFCKAQELGTHFVVRTCVDRLAGDGEHTIADEMEEVAVKGLHRIETRDEHGDVCKATLELKYRRIRVLPPIGKQKKYPELDLVVIHALERDAPKGRKPIEWKLITDLPVRSRVDAIEKLDWYAMRWKIEVFHKILKSGCKAEDSKLRTADRLANLIAVFCILSWRVFWLTMLNRTMPDAPPTMALTESEIRVLDNLLRDPAGADRRRRTLSHYLTKLARLGGYLARASDPPPGNVVIWRGLSRLTDIQIGVDIGAENVGN
jgi:Transposase DNA-binding